MRYISIVYAFASVLILNNIVWPTLTLISVANPWIVGSPELPGEMSHWLEGLPGRQFSASIGFAGALQLPKAADDRARHNTTLQRGDKERARTFISQLLPAFDPQGPTTFTLKHSTITADLISRGDG